MDTSSLGRVATVRRLVVVGALALLAVGVTTGSGPANAQIVPTLSSISPSEGPAAGGTTVTLTGTGLTQDGSITEITFDQNRVLSQDCSSSTTCVVQSPPGVGTVDVVVLNSFGSSNPLQFTYLPPLGLDSANPASGPPSGGGRVTFTGTGFSTVPGGTQFDAGGEVVFTDVTCESSTSCTGLTGPCNAGSAYYPFQVTVDGVVAQFLTGPDFRCQATGEADPEVPGAAIGSSDGVVILADTGTDSTTMALLGAVMLSAAGCSLVLATRRRTANRGHDL